MYNVQAKCNANLYRGVSRRELHENYISKLQYNNHLHSTPIRQFRKSSSELIMIVRQKTNIVRQKMHWYAE